MAVASIGAVSWPAMSTGALLVVLLRMGAMALALWGVLSGASFPGNERLGLADEALFRLVPVLAVVVAALVLWVLAPRLARAIGKATLPNSAGPADVAATAIVALGVWFIGSGAIELLAVPSHAVALRTIALSQGQGDDLGMGLLSLFVEQSARIAFGGVLVWRARRLSAWLSGPA